MRGRRLSLVSAAIGGALASVLMTPVPGLAQQAPGVIGSLYPTQVVAGQTTVVHMALVRNNPVLSVEITPAQGVTVSALTSRDLNQGAAWWDVTIQVARDASPGPRTLVAVQPTGRTAPVTVLIPDHAPQASNLAIVNARMTEPMVDLSLGVGGAGARFGADPLVWFLLACGPGQPEAGVVRGTFTAGTIRASIPNPRTLAGRAGAPAADRHCDLQARATDATGIDTNTVATAFDFQ